MQILTETGAACGELLTAIQQAKRVPANNDIPVMRFHQRFLPGFRSSLTDVLIASPCRPRLVPRYASISLMLSLSGIAARLAPPERNSNSNDRCDNQEGQESSLFEPEHRQYGHRHGEAQGTELK